MIYNEQKLESFCRRAFKYEEQQIIDTHHAIREAITEHFDGKAIQEKYGVLPELDIYLQGSYKNSTNVTQTSDVDLVVQLKNIWRANKESLPAAQLAKYEAAYSNATYPFQLFNADILNALEKAFGTGNVINDNNCLKMKEQGKYCNADVIPSFTYRQYGMFESIEQQSYKEGMYFIANEGKFVRNFPKLHYEALIQKSDATNGVFKETVRMFKNIRDDLTDRGVLFEGIAKSYYIENLLFNVPDASFSPNRIQTFEQIMCFLIAIYPLDVFKSLKCANGIDYLFSKDNWNLTYFQQFLTALIRVKNETQL